MKCLFLAFVYIVSIWPFRCSLIYYQSSNKRVKQIDLNRPYKGVISHTHHGYLHNENDTAKEFSHLTP